jgi:hypothetical protein
VAGLPIFLSDIVKLHLRQAVHWIGEDAGAIEGPGKDLFAP